MMKRERSFSWKGVRTLTAALFLLTATAGAGPAAAGTAAPSYKPWHPSTTLWAEPYFPIPPSLSLSMHLGNPAAQPMNSGSLFPFSGGGAGSALNPYLIKDKNDLILVNSYNTAASVTNQVYYYKLDSPTAYIDISGSGWTPIGSSSTPFTGTFEGNGQTITGLTINDASGSMGDAGLFGYIGGGAVVADVYLTGASVIGADTYCGILAGENDGGITTSHATGSVSGTGSGDSDGGLVGANGGSITSSYAAGSVSGTGSGEYEGGLVGANYGGITSSYATGSVSGSGGSDFDGGLVGGNAGSITSSYATGGVSGSGGNDLDGGLVGANAGTITSSYATGGVSGSYVVGGLAGANAGGYASPDDPNGLAEITDSFATGNVTGTAGGEYEGGLVGANDGGNSHPNGLAEITGSYATGNVTGSGGNDLDGGLAGDNYDDQGTAEISYSYATGSVSGSGGNDCDGGLVGGNAGGISTSYATGSVSGSYVVGGLAGGNTGSITASYATGDVSGTWSGEYGGGLVGANDGGTSYGKGQADITDSYATGGVRGSGGGGVNGGLVGYNWGDGGSAAISYSYAAGQVTGTTDVNGGLVGANDDVSGGSATIRSSYWDTATTGQVYASGEENGTATSVYGEATSLMWREGTFTGWNFTGPGPTWGINENISYPYLNGVPPTTPPTVSVSASPSSVYGTVYGNGTYNVGDRATVQAVPNSGFTFVDWIDGGNTVSDSVYTFTMDAADVNLTADFIGSADDITGFSVPNQLGSSTIDATNHTVTFHMPYGAVVTNLAAAFSLSTGATATVNGVTQVSGETTNNFTDAVTYAVYAQDNVHDQDWTVTCLVNPNTTDAITAYSLDSVNGTIDNTAHTVAVTVPYGTDVTNLVAAYSLSAGATARVGGVTQVDGKTANDFTNAVTYAVCAQDGVTEQDWTVTVTVAPNSAADITGFTVPNQAGSSTIDATNHTVTFHMPYGSDVTALTPTVTVSAGATVYPASGTVQDFTGPVTYTVTAGSGTQQQWTVTCLVNSGGGGGGGFAALAITTVSVPAGTVGQGYSQTIGTNGAGTAPYTFAVTGGSLPPGLALEASTGQISGTPTAAGTYTFTVTVKDANDKSASESYNVTVSPPGSAIESLTLAPSVGGMVSLGSNVTLTIPAGALQGGADVNVTIQTAASRPPAPQGYTIMGAYEFTVNGQDHYTFNSPVTLTFHFGPSQVPPNTTPVVCYFDGKQWVLLTGTVDWTNDTITVTVDHFTEYAVMAQAQSAAPPAVTLKDIAGNWAGANIKKLVARGAVTGYPDGTFRPDNNVTRAEFATVLVRALNTRWCGYPAPKSGPVFADVKGNWAQSYISTAAAYGIVSGYDASHFGPNDLITREQMTAMVVRAAKLVPAVGGLSFKDAAQIDPWARGYVETAVRAGLIKGYPDGTFRPLADATRAEAVSVIADILK